MEKKETPQGNRKGHPTNSKLVLKKNQNQPLFHYLCCGKCPLKIAFAHEFFLCKVESTDVKHGYLMPDTGKLFLKGDMMECSVCGSTFGTKHKGEFVLFDDAINVLCENIVPLSIWMKSRESSKFTICPHFERTKQCNFGDSCVFLHGFPGKQVSISKEHILSKSVNEVRIEQPNLMKTEVPKEKTLKFGQLGRKQKIETKPSKQTEFTENEQKEVTPKRYIIRTKTKVETKPEVKSQTGDHKREVIPTIPPPEVKSKSKPPSNYQTIVQTRSIVKDKDTSDKVPEKFPEVKFHPKSERKSEKTSFEKPGRDKPKYEKKSHPHKSEKDVSDKDQFLTPFKPLAPKRENKSEFVRKRETFKSTKSVVSEYKEPTIKWVAPEVIASYYESICLNPMDLKVCDEFRAVINRMPLSTLNVCALIKLFISKQFLSCENVVVNSVYTEISFSSFFKKNIPTQLSTVKTDGQFVIVTLNFYEIMLQKCPESSRDVNLESILILELQDSTRALVKKILSLKSMCLIQMDRPKVKVSTEHLNAVEDISNISIWPTLQNLTNRDTLLTKNHFMDWNSVKEYVGVHFRLLLEEYLNPLRDGLHKYVMEEKQKFGDLPYFEKCRVTSCSDSKSGPVLRISFKMDQKMSIKLTKSKRLMENCLLVFFEAGKVMKHEPLIGTVATRNLEKFTIDVLPQNNSVFKDVEYIMFESPCFWPSIESVVKLIKSMNPEKTLPFQKILCFHEEKQPVPSYIRKNPIMDISPILGKYETYRKNSPKSIDVTKGWVDQTYLDESQSIALQHILTSEVALVKGPPGTGKTFIGVKAVEVISRHLRKTNQQIVMICYTNHALDQFLEEIAHFEKNFVRIGGKSKSENPLIMDRNLFNLRMKEVITNKGYGKLKFEYHQVSYKVIHYWNRLIVIKDPYRILKLFQMNDFLTKLKVLSDGKTSYSFESMTEVATIWFEGSEKSYMDNRRKQEKARKEKKMKNKSDRQEKGKNMLILNKVNENGEIMEDDVEEEEEIIVVAGKQKSTEKVHAIDSDEELELRVAREEIREINDELFLDDDVETLSKLVSDTYLGDSSDEEDENLDDDEEDFEQILADLKINTQVNPWSLSLKNRKLLISTLFADQEKKISAIIKRNTVDCIRLLKEMQELNERQSLTILKQSRVVALTSTGAAMNQSLLNSLAAPVYIIEEAGELLESQIFAILGNHVQHLILIGDEQQLRPKVNNYNLEKKFNFAISMFERLVKREIGYSTILTQQRMRPEISKITRLFYKELKDHPKVVNFPNVPGIAQNVLFFTHNKKENDADGTKSNDFEAEMAVGLAEYLSNQLDYSCKDITIVTPYQGQRFKIKTLATKKGVDVRVVTIDDYQGEENKVIILSLVRSNQDDVAGFVEIENRIIVSLSRAKYGLYIFGNSSMLQKKDNWFHVIESMEEDNRIVDVLPLYCSVHGTERGCNVYTPQGFQNVSHGGCQETCFFQYDCGHMCGRKCHPKDPNHVTLKCTRTCPIKRDGCGHECGQICHHPKKCTGNCKVKVVYTFPDCGHPKQVECSVDRSLLVCELKCGHKLPCGHICASACKTCKTDGHVCTATVKSTCKKCKKVYSHQCGRDEGCTHECKAILPCGHPCSAKCSDCVDNKHKSCGYNCQRTLFCGHECKKHVCNEKCPNCTKTCFSKCFHGFQCKRPCQLSCVQCLEACPISCTNEKCKLLNPTATCSRTCCEPCDRPPCNERCDKILPCKHSCRGLCGETCPRCLECFGKDWNDTIYQYTFSDLNADDLVYELECGHIFMVDGLDQLMNTKKDELGYYKCPNCQKPILTAKRYQKTIKECKADIQMIKDRIEKEERENKEKEGREMAIQSMGGLRASHFYKCPNGHLYYIGECGGAMQEGKCGDCGAPIGGQNHQLRSDNQRL